MKFFFIWFSIFIYTYNSAQISIQGNISDTSNTPLAGVRVMIRDLSSGISKYTNTDSIGFYKIVLPPTKISFLEVQLISYKTYTAHVNSSTSQTLETIRLQSDATLLKEITIEGIQQRGTQKGDTTVFNADAFKVNTDASVQDLVRKMPGVTLENNQVKVNGETVQKVLLDGKPFLGDDANAALRQLPAEIVDKVEFFDKQSDQAAFTGFNDGDPLKTINLISRKNKNKGIFGKSNLAAGPEASDAIKSENLRSHSALNYNNFKNSSRITLLGLANNVNQQNFTASDLGGIGNTGNSRSNGSGRSDNASGFNINPLNGIVETQALGSNYSYQNASVQLSASYFFNAGSTLNKSQLLRQFYTNSQ
ncbi:MAG: carboxypeptidase-like regulatory domain-containing protein, partial [Bacteroidia bacterium]